MRLNDPRLPLDRFRAIAGDLLDPADRMEFFANRVTPQGQTWLRIDSGTTDRLARLVLEEYVIGDRMHGVVIMAFPRPESELPIFHAQLGGVGDRSIAVVDVSPTVADADLAGLAPSAARHRERLGLEPTSTAWLQEICSPHLLHCNYRELDEPAFVDAVEEYLRWWLENCYRDPAPATDPVRQAEVRAAILRFKTELHHHDPAYGFFARAWGKPTADAFIDLECGDDPVYLPPAEVPGPPAGPPPGAGGPPAGPPSSTG